MTARSRMAALLALQLFGCAGGQAKSTDEDDDPETDDTARGGDDGAGSGGGADTIDGSTYFPLDGTRSWAYAPCWPSDDGCTPEADDDRRTVTQLEPGDGGEAELHYADGAGETLYRIVWRSTSETGVAITGWAAGDAPLTVPTTPLMVLGASAAPGDAIQGAAGDDPVTATFEAHEEVTTHWTTQPWEAVIVRLEGPGGQPFLGTWTLTRSWGAAAFQGADSDVPWVLSDARWEP